MCLCIQNWSMYIILHYKDFCLFVTYMTLWLFCHVLFQGPSGSSQLQSTTLEVDLPESFVQLNCFLISAFWYISLISRHKPFLFQYCLYTKTLNAFSCIPKTVFFSFCANATTPDLRIENAGPNQTFSKVYVCLLKMECRRLRTTVCFVSPPHWDFINVMSTWQCCIK